MKKRMDRFKSMGEAEDQLIRDGICQSRTEANRYILTKLPKESYYQNKIIKGIREAYPNAFVWKATAGAYSRQGIPDVCAVIDGRYYGFEVKRPYIGVLSQIQEATIKKIQSAGGVAGVVCFPEDAIRLIEGGKAIESDHV